MPNVDDVSQDLLDLLMWDRVQSGGMPEETFEDNLKMCQENPAFEGVLKTLQSGNPVAYQALLAMGPDGIVALTGQLAVSGVVTRKEISTAAKIKTKAKADKPWFKQISNDVLVAVYQAANDHYEENLDEYRTKHGDVVPDTLAEMLRASGKAAQGTTVDKWEHPQTGVNCPLALTFRIDYNTPSRNGVKKAADAANASDEAGEADSAAAK